VRPYICYIFIWLLTATSLAKTLTVEFMGEKPTTGNLIVVISPKQFRPHSPGFMNAYAGQLLVESGLTLQKNQTVKLELPKGVDLEGWHAGAYLDENRNFMWRCLPDAGEFFSSELVRLTGKSKTLVVDSPFYPHRFKAPPWIHEHSFISSTLLDQGFSRKESTLRFLVGLPPGYWVNDRPYPVLFVSHGFNGNRWGYLKRYKMWRDQMESEPMILISLDSFGRFGHHLFLNSQANGSRFDVFTKELVPYIDKRFRTNGKRVVYGQSSGGWTAISLLRRAPELIHAAVATGPDPLELDDWWMGENKNMYTDPNGTQRELVPAVGLTMKQFVKAELQTKSFGQFAGFLAAFSPYRPDEDYPLDSPFDLETGEMNEEIWELWKENDMGAWARSHPEQARSAFSNRLALIVGDQDEFGLLETTRQFSETLKSLDIPHELTVIEGARHSNYLEEPDFAAECWSLFFQLANR
jgi:pimeloyl-ACP methyl ester carboxylesterase